MKRDRALWKGGALNEFIPGLVVAVGIAVLATVLARLLPIGGGVVPALVLGIIVGNVWQLPAITEGGIGFAERNMLSYAIVLMGFELQIDRIASVGWMPLLFVAILVFIVMLVAVPLGMRLGFSKPFATMIGAGHAICGASAVAALGPLVKARQEEIGVSIGIVNLMGTVGIAVAPPLVLALQYSAQEAGYLIGGVLNAVGQVVAAGFSVGREAGEIATLVKLQRILFLGPLVLGASFLFHLPADGARKKFPIPGFIYGFALASIIGSLMPHEVHVIPVLREVGKFFLIVAMAGIGLRIRFRHLIHYGPKAILFGGMLFVLQLVVAMLVIPLMR